MFNIDYDIVVLLFDFLNVASRKVLKAGDFPVNRTPARSNKGP